MLITWQCSGGFLKPLQMRYYLPHFRDDHGEGDGTPLQYSCLEKSHGQRSLVGCSPWGRKELDATERLPFHFSLSCTGEGNGNPLQCSCLENPRDGGAWWAAVYGVAQSWTQVKWLSSSSRDDQVEAREAEWFVYRTHEWWNQNLSPDSLILDPQRGHSSDVHGVPTMFSNSARRNTAARHCSAS